jgi:hypothetical protein
MSARDLDASPIRVDSRDRRHEDAQAAGEWARSAADVERAFTPVGDAAEDHLVVVGPHRTTLSQRADGARRAGCRVPDAWKLLVVTVGTSLTGVRHTPGTDRSERVMPVIHVRRVLRGASRAAVTVAVAVALLAYAPGPATAAGPVTATAAGPVAAASTRATAASPADLEAAKARLLAAIEPCSTRVPRNDVLALGRCAVDLAIPEAQAHGIIDFLLTFFHCLSLQWAGGTWDGPYPSISACMEIHGY